MDKEETKKDEKIFVDGLVKEQSSTYAIQKLYRKPLPVSVYRHTSLVEALEAKAVELEEAFKQLDGADKIEAQKNLNELKSELDKLEADKIEGVLSPLTYRDVNDIKAAITEAVIHFQEYKFDMNVIMARIAAEERYMTVFCALKKKDSPSNRFFDTLDDVAGMEEATIYHLYNLWERHFVLTDSELKN